MTNPKRAVIGTVIGVLIGFYFKTPFNDADWHGTVDGRLKFLPQAFKSMLEEQSEGLALAVYSDGEMLADLWGGYADKSSARLWDRDTLTNVFSTAKSIGALIIAILVTRGKLAYEDRVPKFWPEFAQNGKENITVQWIVEHKAGLVKFDGDFPIDHANDYRKVSKLIENSKPMWPAGTETGYHSITYGWILDQIVRRVDDKHRSLSQFYNEEIRILAKDDLYIGLPRSEHYRVARITHASRPNFIKSWVTSYFRIRHLLNSIKSGDLMRLMYASSDYPKWMTLITNDMPYNNPIVREVENVAANAIASARGLADSISVILKHNLISAEVLEKFTRPTEHSYDVVLNYQFYRGHGFFYEPHPIKKNSFIMGHSGFGMQHLLIDLESKTVLAILRNGLSWDMRSEDTAKKLFKQILVGIGRPTTKTGRAESDSTKYTP